MNAVRKFINEVRLYAVALGKWLAVAALTGVLCGLIGSAFALSVGYVTRLRAANAARAALRCVSAKRRGWRERWDLIISRRRSRSAR